MKAGRKPTFCKHGISRFHCKICQKEYNRNYYQKYWSQGKTMGQKKKQYNDELLEFTELEVNEKTRNKFKPLYYQENIITQAILNNKTRPLRYDLY